jgi:CubicO group peptidase (beta-lactamase class C family)
MSVTDAAIARASELKIDIERLSRLDNMLNKWLKEGIRERFVIKVNRYGIPIFEGTYGDLGKDGKQLRMDTIYPVASNTKPIIAALLLLLQEEGEIDLTDPVSQYLGDYLGEGRERIVIWHFLTHSSGIKDDEFDLFVKEYIKEKFNIELDEKAGEEEWLKVFLSVHRELGLEPGKDDKDSAHKAYEKIVCLMPVKNEPRKGTFYCNFGYQKCKEIITKVTGETIDAFAKRKLFDPLGMVDSHFNLPEEKWDRVVGRSDKAVGHGWQNTPRCYINESGAGGLKTTALDILKFAEMIRNDGKYEGKRIMSHFSVREMKTNQNTNLPGEWDAWTMGFNIKHIKKDDTGNLRSSTTLDHGGYGGCKFVIDPEEGLTYAIYCVEVNEPTYNVFGRFTNMLYSSLLE